MESRYDTDFETALKLMKEHDTSPFMAAVADLIGDLHREHQQASEGGKCTSSACECWSDPDYSIDWPCSWWMNANRVAMAWLLERAQGIDKSPEERQREAARERKRRQRERESQESTAPQVDAPCPQGTDGGLPRGLAEASQVRSQGDSQRDGKSEASAMAPAKASAKQVLRQVP